MILSMAVVAFFAVCTDAQRPDWPALPDGAVTVPFEVVQQAHAAHSGIPDRRRLVIRDHDVWVAVWDELQAMTPTPEAPAVDFETQMVVVATIGARSSGGHEIAIDGVFEAAGDLLIRVLETSPGPNCLVTQMVTAPATAVIVPRSDSVDFVEATRSTGPRRPGP